MPSSPSHSTHHHHVLLLILALLTISGIAWLTYRHCVRSSATQATKDTLESFNMAHYQTPDKHLDASGKTDTKWHAPPIVTADGDKCISHTDQLMTNLVHRSSDPSGYVAQLTPAQPTTTTKDTYTLRLIVSSDTVDHTSYANGKQFDPKRRHISMSCTFDVTLAYVFRMSGTEPMASRRILMKNQKITYHPGSEDGTTTPAYIELKLCFPDPVSASRATITELECRRVDTNGGMLVVDRAFVVRTNGAGMLVQEYSWPVGKIGFVSRLQDVTLSGEGGGGSTRSIAAVESAIGRFKASATIGHEKHSIDAAALVNHTTTQVRRFSLSFSQIGSDADTSSSGMSGRDVTLVIAAVSDTTFSNVNEQYFSFVEQLVRSSSSSSASTRAAHPPMLNSVSRITIKNAVAHRTYHISTALAYPTGALATNGNTALFYAFSSPVRVSSFAQIHNDLAMSPETSAQQDSPAVYMTDLLDRVVEAHTFLPLVSGSLQKSAGSNPHISVDNTLFTGSVAEYQTSDTYMHLAQNGQVAEHVHAPNRITTEDDSTKPVVLRRTLQKQRQSIQGVRGFELGLSVHLPHVFSLVNTDALQYTIRFEDGAMLTLTTGQDRVTRLVGQPSPDSPETALFLQQKQDAPDAPDLDYRLIFFQNTFTLLVNRKVVKQSKLPASLQGSFFTARNLGSGLGDVPSAVVSGQSSHSYSRLSCATLVCDPHVTVGASLLSAIRFYPSRHQLNEFSTHHIETVMPRVAYQYFNPLAVKLLQDMMSFQKTKERNTLDAVAAGDLAAELIRDLDTNKGSSLTEAQIGPQLSPHGGVTVSALFNMPFINKVFGSKSEHTTNPNKVFNRTRGSSPARYRTVVKLDTVLVAIQQRLPKNPEGHITDYFAYELVVFFPTECGSFDTQPFVLATDTTLSGNTDGFFALTYSSDGTNDRVCLLTHRSAIPLKMVASVDHAMNRKPITSSGKSLFQTCTYDRMWSFAIIVMNRLTPTFCNPYDTQNKCSCSSKVTSSPNKGVTNFPHMPSRELISSMRIPNTTCNSSSTVQVDSADECMNMLFPSSTSQYKGVTMVSYDTANGTCTLCGGEKPSLVKKEGSVAWWNSRVIGDQVMSRVMSYM
jgi:hypothetical protein